ncbi:MAG: 2-oxoacid:acceptor oxidoreductase family protein [Clostridiales Family XIII bacterium]|nr:2-oxoacid:acceptor oxidoreductase family protein [Clostridiales Family XIII bacterium]
MIEIRWHGRGGQGAKTAALLLADAAFETGLYVQGFPEYGPERMGAPITAYNRLSESPIRVHSNIYDPDIVVVVDETLLKSVDVAAGLKETGKLLINTNSEPESVLKAFPGFKGSIYAIDAADISRRTIGRNLPNTPLLSAVVKLSGIMDEESFFENMKKAFREKFSHKTEMIDGNMNAVREAWASVVPLNEVAARN